MTEGGEAMPARNGGRGLEMVGEVKFTTQNPKLLKLVPGYQFLLFCSSAF